MEVGFDMKGIILTKKLQKAHYTRIRVACWQISRSRLVEKNGILRSNLRNKFFS